MPSGRTAPETVGLGRGVGDAVEGFGVGVVEGGSVLAATAGVVGEAAASVGFGDSTGGVELSKLATGVAEDLKA
jgi:hypothetical protein